MPQRSAPLSEGPAGLDVTPDSLTRRSLVVLFGAALLIRLLFLLGYLDVPTFSQPEGGDAIFYDRIA
ncbi:MAG: hypothetical protein AAF721_41365, partial [Myxococcota bacterium]